MSIHKAFISYHHKDQRQVDEFVRIFDEERNGFITRGLGIEIDDDIINSDNPQYVMSKIRERYLKDSTVTIVIIGNCTWSRRYVDWEIQSSLRQGEDILPNGLMGIRLSSNYKMPERLAINKKPNADGEYYGRLYDYPKSVAQLKLWIDDAYNTRFTHAHLIDNPRTRYLYNRDC